MNRPPADQSVKNLLTTNKMSNKNRTCPSCGEIVEEGEMYCPSCGERLADEPAEQAESLPAEAVNRSVTTGGGRTNVMGDNVVNAQDQSTTTNVDNSQTTNTNTVNNVQNTSSSVTNQQTVGSIDNSQQVVNNITIIGGAGMTLPGGITIPGGPAQPSGYQTPQQKAVPQSQPRQRPGAPASKAMPAFEVGEDENGQPVIREPRGNASSKSAGISAPAGKSGGGGMGKWLLILGIAAVVAVVLMLNMGEDKTPAPVQETPVPTEQAAPVQAAPKKKAAVQEAAPKQEAAPRTDANYEAGMKAYNDGDGLEAVRKFQASGSAEANYMLGVIYETGCGSVAANPMKARSFFKKAAAQGSAEAKAKL